MLTAHPVLTNGSCVIMTEQSGVHKAPVTILAKILLTGMSEKYFVAPPDIPACELNCFLYTELVNLTWGVVIKNGIRHSQWAGELPFNIKRSLGSALVILLKLCNGKLISYVDLLLVKMPDVIKICIGKANKNISHEYFHPTKTPTL